MRAGDKACILEHGVRFPERSGSHHLGSGSVHLCKYDILILFSRYKDQSSGTKSDLHLKDPYRQSDKLVIPVLLAATP